jgi:uncharacterized LabA/DUF88 family protein
MAAKKETLLIVDGAYLKVGASSLEFKTGRSLSYSEFVLKQMFEYIQTKARTVIDEKVFISATELSDNIDIKNQNKKQNKLLKQVGFDVDMRWFKPKNSYCKDKDCKCPHNKKTEGFKPIIQNVQAQCDIAIAVKPIQFKVEHPEMKNLILVAGDGDFLDVVKLMKNTFKVKVIIFSWSGSFNYEILKEADESFFFDDLFGKISHEKGRPSNGDQLMQEPLFNQQSAAIIAAVHKYPKEDDYEACRNFALQLI